MRKHTILFLAANPSGTSPLALDREARAIHVELERSGYRDCFELVTRWAAEPLDLLRELRKLKPTIVHFSGHGGQDTARAHWTEARRDGSQGTHGTQPREDARDGEHGASRDMGRRVKSEPRYGLFFQNPDGSARFVSAEAIEQTFGAAGASVKLIVLNACYTDVQADALLAHVDCVVGMGGAVHDTAARSFAVGFYGGLGEREPVADAFKQGRAAIGLEGLPDGERPQLRVRPGVDAARLVLADPR